MKFISTLTALLLGIQPAIADFKFTSPTAGSTLNLSAPSIDIEWDGSTSQFPLTNILFYGQTGSGNAFTYTLVENISVTVGKYTWQPANVSAALQSTKVSLTHGQNYDFQANTHQTNSAEGATITSSSYSVTGYPYFGAAASLQPQIGAILLIAMVSMTLLA